MRPFVALAVVAVAACVEPPAEGEGEPLSPGVLDLRDGASSLCVDRRCVVDLGGIAVGDTRARTVQLVNVGEASVAAVIDGVVGDDRVSVSNVDVVLGGGESVDVVVSAEVEGEGDVAASFVVGDLDVEVRANVEGLCVPVIAARVEAVNGVPVDGEAEISTFDAVELSFAVTEGCDDSFIVPWTSELVSSPGEGSAILQTEPYGASFLPLRGGHYTIALGAKSSGGAYSESTVSVDVVERDSRLVITMEGPRAHVWIAPVGAAWCDDVCSDLVCASGLGTFDVVDRVRFFTDALPVGDYDVGVTSDRSFTSTTTKVWLDGVLAAEASVRAEPGEMRSTGLRLAQRDEGLAIIVLDERPPLQTCP